MTFKVGDFVKCVDNEGCCRNELTKGKLYKIVGDPNNECIYVTDNGGRKFGYFKWRFEFISEKKIIKEFGIVAFMKGSNV